MCLIIDMHVCTWTLRHIGTPFRFRSLNGVTYPECHIPICTLDSFDSQCVGTYLITPKQCCSVPSGSRVPPHFWLSWYCTFKKSRSKSATTIYTWSEVEAMSWPTTWPLSSLALRADIHIYPIPLILTTSIHEITSIPPPDRPQLSLLVPTYIINIILIHSPATSIANPSVPFPTINIPSEI